MRTAHFGLKTTAILAVLGLSLTACGGNANKTGAAQAVADPGTPVEGGTFTFAEVTPINTGRLQGTLL